MIKDIRKHVDQLIQIITLVMLLISHGASAKSERDAGDQVKMNINISGTVIASGSCVFNAGSGSTVGIDFGSIRYSTLNGFLLENENHEYRKPLNSAMTCTGDYEGAIMTFASSNGTTVTYNEHKLLPVTLNGNASNNLAIMLLVDEQVQDIGTAFNVDVTNPPKLEAELTQVGDSDNVPDGATLTSSATLTLSFQ
ncbi:hypothetical protein R2320_002998 [Cronobacter turicensis]|nr:hypothetical protein [Cronobacter turicensis]